MELKPGYKHTEVGMVPEDWVVQTIKNIAVVVRGGSPRPAGDPKYFDGSFIPWLTVASLTNIPAEKLYVSDTASYLTEAGSLCSRTLTPGTLIIANSGATLGVAKILGVKCCANDGIAALQNLDKGVSAKFVAYYINSQTKYLREVVATGNGQPNLNTGLVGEIIFPIPPTLAEQQSIADALSDANALIESLDQLLTKKRQIKQGTMQELLSGQRRLPGFSGEWDVTQLGSVLKFQVGFPFSSRFFNEKDLGIRLVKNRDLKSDDQIICYSGPYESTFLVTDGDVLIGMDGDFLPCRWSKGFALLNQRVGRIIPNSGLDLDFAYYYLLGPLKEIEQVTSSTTVKHLSHGDIEGIEKALPRIEEQMAIASVLSTMDDEITALESQLQKARHLKQGMMQELLTGRIRLV